ncbi:MAG: flavodoxin family protein [Candidatus Hodarchaeales archaeon]
MNILIVFYSEGGNTKKVAEMLRNKLIEKKYSVVMKNALTAKAAHVEEADLVLIGTPVHGYILFGQKPTKEIKKFLENELPDNLNQKPVIGFATYLFFPAGTLKQISQQIESRNGVTELLIAKRRSNKSELVEELVKYVINKFP